MKAAAIRPNRPNAYATATLPGLVRGSDALRDIGFTLRIRIKYLPPPAQWSKHEIDLRSYQVGHVYDVGPRAAEYLIVMGFAESEMRSHDRPADKPFRRRVVRDLTRRQPETTRAFSRERAKVTFATMFSV